MFAVISTGGKQYKVREGDSLKVEKLPAEEGASVEFDRVLLVGEATVEAHGRNKKVRILKFRRRKHHMKRAGHRQDFTRVKITGIAG